MKKKNFLLLNLMLALIIFIIGCSAEETMPAELSSEEPSRRSMSSSDEDTNSSSQSIYIDNIDALVNSIKSKNPKSQVSYTSGSLNEDDIPEIAVFIGKNPDDIEDKGSLEIYKFNGQIYSLVDKTPMNFDLSNYQIEIGNIAKNQKGILLNNNVGPKSGMTYGFIVEEGKLKSILNPRKVNLVSIFTENRIEDIDGDGILEFSVYTVDPETEDSSVEGSDKMTLWYQWDGKTGAEILEVDRKDLSKDPSNEDLYKKLDAMIDVNFPEFINSLMENKDEISNYGNTELLKKYIRKLTNKSYDKSLEIENLFIQYQEGQSFNYIFDKYGITIEKLNDIDYLNRDKVLKDEKEIKEHIINNRELAYKLNTQEGIYYYLVDYKKLLNLFGDNLTREYSDYLQILALDSENPFLNDGSITISRDNLIDRILITESFKMIYPYSDLIPEINRIYELYFTMYLYGENHDPNFNIDNNKMKESALKDFQAKIDKYEFTNFADILTDFLKWIEENSGFINDDVREKLKNRLN